MDDFKFNLVKQFQGYVSARDKTNLALGALIRGSKNVIKKISGTIAPREGLKRRGSADTTDAGVKASFEWEDSLGRVLPLRVANNKLQVESDVVTAGTPVWYTLLFTQLAGVIKSIQTAPTSSGSGYEVGDILSVAGGTNGTVKVLTISGSEVVTVAIVTKGNGYTTGVKATTNLTDSTATGAEILITEIEPVESNGQPAASLTRFVSDEWWNPDEEKERLVMVRGDDRIIHWSGGIAKLDSATAPVAGVISYIVGTPVAAGSQYTVGDVLDLGGGNNDAQIEVTAINSTSGVTAIKIKKQGSGYNTGIYSPANNTVRIASASGLQVNVTGVITAGTLKISGAETWQEKGFSGSGLIAVGETEPIHEKILYLNGNEYTYMGGEDTDTLTGVTPDPSGEAANSVAIQSVFAVPESPAKDFEADFVKTVNNQLLVGSYSSRIIYISAGIVGDGFPDFVNAGSFVTGDPDQAILDRPARGIGVLNGHPVVFAGDSDMYILTLNESVPVSFTDSTSGTSRFIITKVEKKKLPNLSAALGHEFIDNFSNYLVWIDQNNQLQSLGSFENIAEIKPALLSLPIYDELKDEDFTGGHLQAIQNTIHITAPNSGRDWMYEIRDTVNESGAVISERLWQPPQIRGLSRFAVIDGLIYGHSNSHPEIFKVFDTGQWRDDDDLSYIAVARFAYHNNHDKLASFDKLYLEGYMREGAEVEANIYCDYGGATDLKQLTVNSVAKSVKFFSPAQPPSLGDGSLGANPLGEGLVEDALEQETLPKFRTIRNISAGRSFLTTRNLFEYALEVLSYTTDSRWELSSYGFNDKLTDEAPVFLTG